MNGSCWVIQSYTVCTVAILPDSMLAYSKNDLQLRAVPP